MNKVEDIIKLLKGMEECCNHPYLLTSLRLDARGDLELHWSWKYRGDIYHYRKIVTAVEGTYKGDIFEMVLKRAKVEIMREEFNGTVRRQNQKGR